MTVVALEKKKYDCGNERKLKEQLEAEGFSIFSWQDGPGAYYSPHSHGHDEFIVVHAGSIKFMIAGQTYIVEPGDLLRLPAHTVHEALNDGSQIAKYYICSKR